MDKGVESTHFVHKETKSMRTKNGDEVKTERAFIGDFISTTKKFQPVDASGNKYTNADQLVGVIISRHKESYGVTFGRDIPFCNHLNGLMSYPGGYFLERDEFIVEKD